MTEVRTIVNRRTASPPAPQRSDRANYADDGDIWMAHQEGIPDEENDIIVEQNGMADDMNLVAAEVNADKLDAQAAAIESLASANAYRWSDDGSTRAFAAEETMIFTDGYSYRCLSATTAAQSPITHPAKWKNLSPGMYDIKDHGSVTVNTTIDIAYGYVHKMTVNANITINFDNFTSGKHQTVVLILTDTGDRTITWDSAIKWPYGEAPAQEVNGRNRFVFASEDGGTTIDGAYCGGGFA